MRVAFVVQRYGDEVAGGAEALCRQTAQALARAGQEVTVYTTTARDYLRWAPYYDEGETVDDGVCVRRFAVEPPDPERAATLLRRLALGDGAAGDERAWALAQGPVSPRLLGSLAAGEDDVVALWTYLYATTQLAMALVAERAILVPLAHDEPMFRLGVTRGVVAMARGFAFLTAEERRLVDDVHGVGDRPWAEVGAGLHPRADGDAATARTVRALPERFVLYVGRVDPAKGVDVLVRAHAAYRELGGSLGLVLAGRATGSERLPEWVVQTGFIDEQERSDLFAACEVVALPSTYESLSLVALEAWQAGRPTLANARSDVLAGQTARSGGGLLYDTTESYAAQLRRMEDDPAMRESLGTSGERWVSTHDWSEVVHRWQTLMHQVVPRGTPI